MAVGAPHVKGNLILTRLDFLRNHGGEPAVRSVLERLSPEDCEVLSGLILSLADYDRGLYQRLSAAIVAAVHPEDRRRCFLEMGRASAERNLQGTQRVFLKAGDPHRLLEGTEQLYRHYYLQGSASYRRTGEMSGVLRFETDAAPDGEECLTNVGWFERAIQMVGGLDVQVSHPLCEARGDPCCEYECEWRGVDPYVRARGRTSRPPPL
jgi:uncharacterized protein (TIGR02265 family)